MFSTSCLAGQHPLNDIYMVLDICVSLPLFMVQICFWTPSIASQPCKRSWNIYILAHSIGIQGISMCPKQVFYPLFAFYTKSLSLSPTLFLSLNCSSLAVSRFPTHLIYSSEADCKEIWWLVSYSNFCVLFPSWVQGLPRLNFHWVCNTTPDFSANVGIDLLS